MKPEEIKKALDGMVKFADTVDRSVLDAVDVQLYKDTLDLINQYEAEIKSKQETIDMFTDIGKLYSEIKAEAIKEFAEEIFELFPADKCITVISRVTVKHILKKLVGENG